MAYNEKLLFGGIDSLTYGVYILDGKVDNTANKDMTHITVPGRSGTLVIDNGRFDNVTVSYTCAIVDDAKSDMHAYIAELSALKGYQRLEDDIYDEHYRMGVFQGQVNPTMFDERNKSIFELSFLCKPQKYLKSGEEGVSFTGNRTFSNPTPFDAKPIISVYGTGTGTITIGNSQITINSNPGNMVIDCETEDAYNSQSKLSYNSRIELSGNDFPKLHKGDTTVSLSSGLQVTITPRWWTI